MDPNLQSPQSPLTPIPAMNEKKGIKRLQLIICGIVLLAIGLFVGYFIYSQTSTPKIQSIPTPTQVTVIPTVVEKLYKEPANWKTYINTESQYSYRYPETWFTQFEVEKPCEGCGGMTKGITIKIIQNNDNLSVQEYAQREVDEANRGLEQKSAKLLPMLSHFNGVLANGFPGGGAPGIYAYLQKDTKIYNIQFEGVDDETAKTVLSTFSFIETSGAPAPTVAIEESCGKNAGAAGNAKCATGYTCKYKTPEQVSNGIGTCVKE